MGEPADTKNGGFGSIADDGNRKVVMAEYRIAQCVLPGAAHTGFGVF